MNGFVSKLLSIPPCHGVIYDRLYPSDKTLNVFYVCLVVLLSGRESVPRFGF